MAELGIHEDTLPSPISKTACEELAYMALQQRFAADFVYFAPKNGSWKEMLQEAVRRRLGIEPRYAKHLRGSLFEPSGDRGTIPLSYPPRHLLVSELVTNAFKYPFAD